MKEDQSLIASYLSQYGIQSIFNEKLLPHLSLYSFEPGSFILSQGDAAEYLYVLVKGKVKIYTTSAEGKTLILSFKTPLELIGDIEYIQDIPIINTVEAVSSVSMIGIKLSSLRKYGADHTPLLQFLLKIITEKFCIKSQSLSFHLLYPVEVRLASYLLSVSFDEADPLFKRQPNTISLKDTSNLIGTSYRHLNRVIQQFCSDGLVERQPGGIIVKDRKGLRALAMEDIYENSSKINDN